MCSGLNSVVIGGTGHPLTEIRIEDGSVTELVITQIPFAHYWEPEVEYVGPAREPVVPVVPVLR